MMKIEYGNRPMKEIRGGTWPHSTKWTISTFYWDENSNDENEMENGTKEKSSSFPSSFILQLFELKSIEKCGVWEVII